MPRACSVARRDYSTLYPLFQLLPAASSLWRGFRLAVFEDIIRPAQNWGFLAPARSCRLNERETMPNFFQHRHVTPENATKEAIERARSRESKTSLVDDRTSDPCLTAKTNASATQISTSGAKVKCSVLPFSCYKQLINARSRAR
jgi:hypothetical protein